MKTHDSPVLEMTPDALIEKVTTLPRWRGKFRAPINGTIPIDSVKEVETLIDLLAERFTVSPVSGQEYDTEVKKKAEDAIRRAERNYGYLALMTNVIRDSAEALRIIAKKGC